MSRGTVIDLCYLVAIIGFILALIGGIMAITYKVREPTPMMYPPGTMAPPPPPPPPPA